MNIKATPRSTLFGLAALLVACSAPAPAPLDEPVAASTMPAWTPAPPSSDDAPVLQVDAARSDLRIHVFRGGRAAASGHNHVISAPTLEGWVRLPDATPPDGIAFALRVRADALVIDDPALRADIGDAFSGERSGKDIDGTRRNMLGEKGLEVERYPWIQLQSQTVSGDWPLFVAEVAVSLHGVTRRVPVVIEARRDGERLTATGRFSVSQREFGVEPFSVLGGLLAVQDAVAIAFTLEAAP